MARNLEPKEFAVTIDDFVNKWTDTGTNLWLKSLRVEITNSGGIGEPYDRSEARLETHACVELTDIDDWPDVSESAAIRLGTDASCDRIATLLCQLDERLTRQIERQHQLSGSKPSLSKPVLVVLAGAGFSNGFGLPITDGLKALALRVCPNPKPEGTDEILHLDKYPLSEFSGSQDRIPDIEYLLTIWVDYLDQLDQTKQRDVTSWSRYHDFIENLCCHLYAKSNAALSDHADRFKAMVRWLTEAIRQYDVRFVTFNYDVVLEQICRHAGLQFTYLASEADAMVIPIRKLHGSLNWRELPGKCGAHANTEMIHEGDESHVYAFHDVDSFSRWGSGKPPLIIPPSAGKKYNQILLTTWGFAARDLRVADKILIVGYSFPPLDAFATVRLREVLTSRHAFLSSHPRKITYISPNGADCERVRKLLGLSLDAVREARWSPDHFFSMLGE